MMKNYLLTCFALIVSFNTYAQNQIQFCRHEIESTYKEHVESALITGSQAPELGLTSVPIALTFIMKSDSTSSYYEGLDKEIMDSITTHFLPSGMHFYLAADPVFIYEDLVYEYVIGDHNELLWPGIKNNRINVVVANSVSSSGGASYCGIAQIFPNTVLARYSCVASNTISHEIGHELSLAHTHHTAHGVELVDGSNCETAGDLICDTPADPNRADLITSDCEWEGTYEDDLGYDIHLVDANGDRYDPDVSNLMSYYGIYGCRTDFTFLQSVVMLKRLAQKFPGYGYETPKMLFDVYESIDLCDAGYQVSARVKNPSTEVVYDWDFDSDGTVDASGLDVQHLYTEYGEFTLKLIMTYADGRQYYHSKICEVSYSNETIMAPFLDDFNEVKERKYVTLLEDSPYKWNLKLHLVGGRIVAGDQIHINENSVMEYKVDLTHLDNAAIEFEYSCNEDAPIGGDSLLVEVITCDESITLFEKWGHELGTDGAYETVFVPLPQVDSEVVRIRFTSKGDAQDWHDLYIDNFQVLEHSVTSITNSDIRSLQIYPNPAQSKVQVSTKSEISFLYAMDMYGRVFDLNNEEGAVDISSLPSGVYFMNVLSNEEWHQGKFIKVD